MDRLFPYSGQLTLVSGVQQNLPSIDTRQVFLKAHPGNNGVVYVGNQTGTLSDASGFPLSATDPHITLLELHNLGTVLAYTDTEGDQLCWMILDETAFQWD